MSGIKVLNSYCKELGLDFYERVPKAVFAAIAVSLLTCGGDFLDEGQEATRKRVLDEWTALHSNGIVRQKPIKEREHGS